MVLGATVRPALESKTRIAAPLEKASSVLSFAETKSLTQVQQNFRREYQRQPLTRRSISQWVENFKTTCSVLKRHSSSIPSVSDEYVEAVCQAYQWSPTKSIRTGSHELGLHSTTIHSIMRKRLRLYEYKMQLIQKLQPNDKPCRPVFAIEMLDHIDNQPTYLSWICFTDESMCHVSGKVNKHNCRIWGSKSPHTARAWQRERERESPKGNVWCQKLKSRVIGPLLKHACKLLQLIYVAPKCQLHTIDSFWNQPLWNCIHHLLTPCIAIPWEAIECNQFLVGPKRSS